MHERLGRAVLAGASLLVTVLVYFVDVATARTSFAPLVTIPVLASRFRARLASGLGVQRRGGVRVRSDRSRCGYAFQRDHLGGHVLAGRRVVQHHAGVFPLPQSRRAELGGQKTCTTGRKPAGSRGRPGTPGSSTFRCARWAAISTPSSRPRTAREPTSSSPTSRGKGLRASMLLSALKTLLAANRSDEFAGKLSPRIIT